MMFWIGGSMQTISVREANQNFSHYLSLVDEGHEFLITKRGRPVAKLVLPLPEPSPESSADKDDSIALARKRWQEVTQLFEGSGIQGPFNRDDAYDD
jgi:antitoxin (DNA-binding transcriptional repressor) of toxin-antitoxin stability system